jgi:predicted nucleic-acid-binding Zn-ribbon protein
MEHKWTCMKCNNIERFFASAVEYHTWVVDGDGMYVADHNLDDSNVELMDTCAACGSTEIEWREVVTPMSDLVNKLNTGGHDA